MRAFVGIEVPGEVSASLATLQDDLAASGADVKWVDAGQFHVTLKFLDELSEPQRQAVEESLRRVGSTEAPFQLGLGAVGAFPSLAAPRILWVAVTAGKEPVLRLAQRLEEEARALALRREERPFSAHLTIGRVRSSRQCRALAERLRTLSWRPPEPWRAASLKLYESVLSLTGPRHTVLAEVPLGETAPPSP